MQALRRSSKGTKGILCEQKKKQVGTGSEIVPTILFFNANIIRAKTKLKGYSRCIRRDNKKKIKIKKQITERWHNASAFV